MNSVINYEDTGKNSRTATLTAGAVLNLLRGGVDEHMERDPVVKLIPDGSIQIDYKVAKKSKW